MNIQARTLFTRLAWPLDPVKFLSTKEKLHKTSTVAPSSKTVQLKQVEPPLPIKGHILIPEVLSFEL